MSLRKLGAKQRQVAFSATSTFNQAPYYTAEFDGLELIPLGRCVVDSNKALTGMCAGTQVFNSNCSGTTDNVASVAGQPSTSMQIRSCGSGSAATNVTVDISTACK
jgi:hypothetical protein